MFLLPLSPVSLSCVACIGIHYEREGMGVRGAPNTRAVDGDSPSPHTDCVLCGHQCCVNAAGAETWISCVRMW